MLFRKILKLVFGLVLAGLGFLVGAVTLIGVLDPVGAKMADDADPFGDPTVPISQIVVLFVISVGLLILSGVLLKGLDKKV